VKNDPLVKINPRQQNFENGEFAKIGSRKILYILVFFFMLAEICPREN